MNRTILLALLVAIAVPATGCMDTLKSAMGGDSEDESVNPNALTNKTTPDVPDPVENETKEIAKPPVARITLFGPSGALVYKADFVAGNDTSNSIMTTVGVHSFLASESEAVDGRARLEKFSWDVGGMKMEGRKIEHAFTDAGVHMVKLTITDSLGSKDTQMVHVTAMPVPIVVTETKTGSVLINPVCDASGDGNGVHGLNVLSEAEGKTFALLSLEMTYTELPAVAQDYDTYLLDASGTEVAKGPNGGGVDALKTGALPAGAYTLIIVNCAGLPGDHTIEIAYTYLEQVAGVDGHAHQH